MEWFVLWFALSLIPAVIASKRGRAGVGWFLISILISPLLATIIVLALQDLSKRQCPACNQQIPVGAQVCPFCKQDFATQPVTVEAEFKPDALSKKCPDCAESIKLEALVCRFCGHKFEPAQVQAAIEQAKAEFDADLAAKLANAKRAAIDSSLVCPKCGGLNATSAGGFSLWERMACPDCGHKW